MYVAVSETWLDLCCQIPGLGMVLTKSFYYIYKKFFVWCSLRTVTFTITRTQIHHALSTQQYTGVRTVGSHCAVKSRVWTCFWAKVIIT